MLILPVLDIQNGCVVRGVAGMRDAYRPVESRLADSADVGTIARAFRRAFGLNRLYVADLDAIQHDRPNTSTYRELVADGMELLIDAGLRDVARARVLFDAGAQGVIAGLETSPGIHHLEQLLAEFGADRVIFSLDLKNGRPLAEANVWGTAAVDIAHRAIGAGIRRMIVLDLAGVGTASGVETLGLCRQLREEQPGLELITGGGVRGIDDLRVLHNAGIDAVLVASALHDSSITMDDLNTLAGSD